MITQPIRIQRSRQHKQVSPNGLPIVYVGRPSKWGNPFYIVNEHYYKFSVYCGGAFMKRFNNKSDAVDYCMLCYSENTLHGLIKGLKELKGKNLACWCKIGEPCHADILLKLANS